MKEFGNRNRPPMERHEFRLNYLDADEEPQSFEGQIVPRASAGDLVGMLREMRTGSPNVIVGVMRMLAKVMDNKDGLVPVNWQPEVLAQEPGDERPKSFRGPDGQLYTLDDTVARDKFADQAQWTTRRRWKFLIEDNDDAVIEMEDLEKLLEWVVSLSTDRPTEPRA